MEPILYFPTVVAPITVSYNLSGVSELNLSAETLAKIFQGDITTWNDPAIAADNSGANLPSTPIVVARRAEASGTTSNFTKFLDAAAKGTWTLGSTDSPNWPANTQAGQGQHRRGPDRQGHRRRDRLRRLLGCQRDRPVDGQHQEQGRRVRGADRSRRPRPPWPSTTIKPDLTYNPINAAGADSYPITARTYIILYATQPDAGLRARTSSAGSTSC